MRLLLVGDLRGHAPWLRWVLREAHRYELVALAGDLLDVYLEAPLARQADRSLRFLRALAERTEVAVCSGNHDATDEAAITPRGPLPGWLARLGDEGCWILDGAAKVVSGRLAVTSLGYLTDHETKRASLRLGSDLRRSGDLPWLVLNHHPPASDATIGHEESIAGALLREFRPDFWACSRLYGQGALHGFRWRQTLAGTTVLNAAQLIPAGHPLSGEHPTHIVLDLATGTAEWVQSDGAQPDAAPIITRV